MLTIELVPKTAWFKNLRSDLTDEQWTFIKRQSARRAKHRCDICGGRGPKWPVECHEIWHYDDKQREQTLTGVTSLCPNCHQVKHIGLAKSKGFYPQALKHLAGVNQWSLEHAHQYVVLQFKIYHARSRFAWKTDMSWIQRELKKCNH